jgi:hypothetical protein
MWDFMINMVYEHKVCTRDELFQHIFDVARCVNDAADLLKVTLSIVRQVRICFHDYGGYFEHSLN